MTKVEINPGICKLKTKVTAETENNIEVKIKVATGCKAVKDMMNSLGDAFDAYELCLVNPGCGPLYEYAAEHFPVHVGYPVIAGITKCAEAECGLALKCDADIRFIEE